MQVFICSELDVPSVYSCMRTTVTVCPPKPIHTDEPAEEARCRLENISKVTYTRAHVVYMYTLYILTAAPEQVQCLCEDG